MREKRTFTSFPKKKRSVVYGQNLTRKERKIDDLGIDLNSMLYCVSPCPSLTITSFSDAEVSQSLGSVIYDRSRPSDGCSDQRLPQTSLTDLLFQHIRS